MAVGVFVLERHSLIRERNLHLAEGGCQIVTQVDQDDCDNAEQTTRLRNDGLHTLNLASCVSIKATDAYDERFDDISRSSTFLELEGGLGLKQLSGPLNICKFLRSFCAPGPHAVFDRELLVLVKHFSNLDE